MPSIYDFLVSSTGFVAYALGTIVCAIVYGRLSFFVGNFKKNVGMTFFVESAKTGQVFALQLRFYFLNANIRNEKASQVVLMALVGDQPLFIFSQDFRSIPIDADFEWISPGCSAIDANRIRG